MNAQELFLDELRRGRNTKVAAELAGITTARVLAYCRDDPAFERKMNEAREGTVPPCDPSKERRFKRLTLAEDFFLGMFRMTNSRTIAVPRLEGLPADAEVVDVQYDQWRKCFAVLVASAEFDPVANGDDPPSMAGACAWEMVNAEAVPGLAARKLKVQPDEVLVLSFPHDSPANGSMVARDALVKQAAAISEQLGCKVVLLPEGASLRTLAETVQGKVDEALRGNKPLEESLDAMATIYASRLVPVPGSEKYDPIRVERDGDVVMQTENAALVVGDIIDTPIGRAVVMRAPDNYNYIRVRLLSHEHRMPPLPKRIAGCEVIQGDNTRYFAGDRELVATATDDSCESSDEPTVDLPDHATVEQLRAAGGVFNKNGGESWCRVGGDVYKLTDDGYVKQP